MANLSASALKGKDAHIIAVLDTLAKEIGFGLGLACMEMTETGSGDGDGGGYSYGRRRKWGYSCEEEDEDDEDVDFVEDPERTASIECFVDPDGNPIEDDDLQADDSLHEELKSKGHYNQEYEGYMGNYAGTLERFYRSSILIIWPRWSNIGGGNADRRATGSFERLEACDSDTPTAEDRSDFEYLCEVVRFMDDTQDDAIEILFDTAVRWCDVQLWSKAVAAVCGGVGLDAFGLEHLRAGYEAFGFDAIAKTLRPIIIASTSNGRLQFTKNLCDLQECDAAQLNAFVDELRTEILANLRPYSSADELQAFATEVMTDGGAPRLRELLLPQIQKLSGAKNAYMLDAFLDWLHGAFSASPSADAQETAALRDIIKSLLDMLVSFKELFASTTTQTRAHQWAQAVNTVRGDPNVAISLINKCLQYDNAPLALSLLEKMVNQALRTATKLGTVEAPATLSAASTNVILEIVVAVIPGVKPLFEAKAMDVGPQLARMAEAAVTVKLAVLKAKAAGAVVSREELASLLDFTKGLSNANALLGLIIVGLKSLPWNETTWTLCLEEFHSRRASNEALFGPHVLEMSKLYAQKASVQASSYYGVASATANATKAMKLCYLTGGPESFVIVLSRILEPKNENYITNVLVPLIPELKTLATTHNVPLTRAPFSEAIQRIVAVWMAVVLGPQPNMATVQDFASRVNRWTCTCAPCTTLVQFLRAADKDTVQLYRIGAPKVNHVRSEVSTKIPAAYLTLETVRTSPQTLNVKKAAEIARAGKWGSLIAQGRKVLASIGNDALLRSIWGPAYATALGPLLTQEQRAVPVRVQPAPAPVAAPRVPAKRKADTRDVIEIDSD
ncbi:hypothetical protein HMN09_01155800 [Mycena chlorophos]|uniref:Uncharacterized protein n=1 Tax=Mycena chlorophos TaxID=658473 RepID=A0A8H6VUC6_MYCCL|nr:hypothetical protein HMN09_01155800 [Mycena chlorophos]